MAEGYAIHVSLKAREFDIQVVRYIPHGIGNTPIEVYRVQSQGYKDICREVAMKWAQFSPTICGRMVDFTSCENLDEMPMVYRSNLMEICAKLELRG